MDILFTYLNFDEKCFLVTLKAKYQNVQTSGEICIYKYKYFLLNIIIISLYATPFRFRISHSACSGDKDCWQLSEKKDKKSPKNDEQSTRLCGLLSWWKFTKNCITSPKAVEYPCMISRLKGSAHNTHWIQVLTSAQPSANYWF